ncbi:MAG: biopolymer transporter ExbD [Bacteroidia bacterium]|jgi:biopolymer transport protein ExbD|nr:biopolymer transporter ExbD [Bacteroidia bacterium]
MNLSRRHKESAEVFTDSLSDIMFFLLLFFIILSTLVNPNVIKLNLPTSKNPTNVNMDNVNLVVNGNHEYFIEGAPITFAELETALKAVTTDKKTDKVILSMDKTLTVQDLADVMQIGANLKLKIVLSTKAVK